MSMGGGEQQQQVWLPGRLLGVSSWQTEVGDKPSAFTLLLFTNLCSILPLFPVSSSYTGCHILQRYPTSFTNSPPSVSLITCWSNVVNYTFLITCFKSPTRCTMQLFPFLLVTHLWCWDVPTVQCWSNTLDENIARVWKCTCSYLSPISPVGYVEKNLSCGECQIPINDRSG